MTETETQKDLTKFVAVCPNYWGAGATADEAKRNMKRHGGTLRGEYTVVQVTPPAAIHANHLGPLFPVGTTLTYVAVRGKATGFAVGDKEVI